MQFTHETGYALMKLLLENPMSSTSKMIQNNQILDTDLEAGFAMKKLVSGQCKLDILGN